MENFQFCASTNILFGKNQIQNLPDLIEAYGKRVLLVYGGGSIKRMGLYDTIQELLSDCDIYELGGISPNPKIESVREGVSLCQKHQIDVILAVGGGSIIDCGKIIAAATFYDGDAWEMIKTAVSVKAALPLITVVTLAATGSEYDAGAVISNSDTKEKLGYDSEWIRPKASILDPTYTFTVPVSQTVAGTIDMMSHVLEQYFVPKSSILADMLCESVLKTIIQYAPVAAEEPENYEARAQLMWVSSIADNGILSLGNQVAAFSCHGIEHELSAWYDITHGVGLAILTPHWMRYILNENTVSRFAHYGIAVWGIDSYLDPFEIANRAIDATENFFKSLNVPMTLSSLNIEQEHFDEMAERAVTNGMLDYAYVPLKKTDVKKILEMCL